ncbi:hypothetical protein, partial [Coxiella endosymbiont of Ornithodoros amblus]|uniref:hypothetical protein n=1 Tax=Coxiella endosymbiont of Ornithodoros amblus TaxID=1656166 RepID=UPI00244DD21D
LSKINASFFINPLGDTRIRRIFLTAERFVVPPSYPAQTASGPARWCKTYTFITPRLKLDVCSLSH